MERAGLAVPDGRPPSFVLGAIEATPLELAGAYTVFAAAGQASQPLAVTHMETPAGVSLHWGREKSRRAASEEAAYLVRHLMRGAAEEGTARATRLPGLDVGAKTGSSSGERDAWLAGDAGSVVAVVWVGLDDGKPLGLSGAAAAAPVWREFMAAAAPARPPHAIEPPEEIVSAWIDPFTGRRLQRERRGAYEELFRAGHLPQRRRWFRADPLPPIE
jgi:penicillin-binding protein 1A